MVLLAGMLAGRRQILAFFHGQALVETFHFGQGRTITILAELVWEVNCSFNYSASQGPAVQTPRTFFYACSPTVKNGRARAARPEWISMSGGQGSIVGIARSDDPTTLLLIHDFSTGESWPAKDDATLHVRLLDRLFNSIR